MRIFAAGIATETNTFCPIPTGPDDFQVERGGKTHATSSFDLDEIWGRKARDGGHTFVRSLMAWAQPAGITVGRIYEGLREELLADLRAAMPVDVVVLMLHGAMVAQGYDDCEEDLIRHVREIVGPSAVIGVELDLHCHLSNAKIAHADIMVTYKEYPHTDINDRAQELFDLAVAARLGKIRPTMALFDCRMVGLYPGTRQPMRAFIGAMMDGQKRKGVLSISFGHGFQFADVPHMGSKLLAITDGDRALAEDIALKFGMQAHEMRREISFGSLSLPLDVALSRALVSDRGPVVVADQSDNIGGGAPGDATFALRWLQDHQARAVAVAILYDPEVVRIAKKAGVGARLHVRVGGKMGPTSGDPLDLEVTVLAIQEAYLHSFPQQSGAPLLFDIGDVVSLQCRNGVDIVVSAGRCQCYSPSIFDDLAIDSRRKQVLIVKSTQHFQGAFAPIASEIVYMAGPGAVPPDPRQICYSRVNTSSMYPWVESPFGQ